MRSQGRPIRACELRLLALSLTAAWWAFGAAPLAGVSCPGGNLQDMVSSEGVKLSARGFTVSLLGEGFRLEQLSLRDEGTCGALVAQALWYESQAGRGVQITQRQGETLAPVLEEHAARFSSGGYGYTLSLDPSPGTEVEIGAGRASRELLLSVIHAIAPTFEEACFSQETEGTWSDLAGLGLGDPRSALPTGFQEIELDFVFDAKPASSCPVTVPLANPRTELDAFFSNGAGGDIQISIQDRPIEEASEPGVLDESGLAWSNGRFDFSISGTTGDGTPFGRNALLALAKALDPKFSTDCLLETTPLSLQDLAALGFREPVPSESFVLVASSFSREAVSDSCSQNLTFRGEDVLSWSFEEKDPGSRGIVVRVVRPVAGGFTPAGPEMDEGYILWTDAGGTSYSVSGFQADEDGPVTSFDDELSIVAQSLDPTLEPEQGAAQDGEDDGRGDPLD